MSPTKIAGGSRGRGCSLSPAPRRGVPTFRAFLSAGLFGLLFLWPPAAIGAPPVCRIGPGGTWECPAEASTGHPAVVRVRNEMRRYRNYGSGTLIEDSGRSMILTAAHTFREGAGKVTVTFAGGQVCNAQLMKADRAWDLALLSIDAAPAAPVPIAEAAPGPSESTQACGWGTDSTYRCTTGRVRGYVTAAGTDVRQTLVTTGGVRAGDSGGPIFNSAGQLVAVIWGTDGTETMGTCCLRIRKFLGFRPPAVNPCRPPVPPASPKPPASDPCEDLRVLVQANAEAIAMLLEAARLPGPPGPKGEPGPPGETPLIDLDILTDRVITKLPPLYVRHVDEVTGAVTLEEIFLGEGFTIRTTPPK